MKKFLTHQDLQQALITLPRLAEYIPTIDDKSKPIYGVLSDTTPWLFDSALNNFWETFLNLNHQINIIYLFDIHQTPNISQSLHNFAQKFKYHHEQLQFFHNPGPNSVQVDKQNIISFYNQLIDYQLNHYNLPIGQAYPRPDNFRQYQTIKKMFDQKIFSKYSLSFII